MARIGAGKTGKSAASVLFRPVQARRISDEIGEQIRQKLLSEQLKPGDKLPAERELAIQLGVSRNTVREALRSLEIAGLLTMQKGAHGGAFIGYGDTDAIASSLRILFHLRGLTIDQLTEARIWIGEIITREACERATEEDFALLEENIAAAEAAYERGDLEAKLGYQIEFHNILARATKNPVISLVMQSLLEIMHNFAAAVGPEENDIALVARRRLMPLLRARRTKEAIKQMTSHLEALRDRYVKVVRKQAETYRVEPVGRAMDAKARKPGKRVAAV
jgi:GntR family transcriptional repressor for pyruvate dehydrogenase complex